MSANKKWIRAKSSWSEVFKRGFNAGANARLRFETRENRYPVRDKYKDVDRAASRAVEGRHLGNDNGIRNGYRSPY